MKWRVDGNFDSDTAVDIMDDNDVQIGEHEPFDGDWSKEEIAHVHLIASAPQLLDALKESIKAVLAIQSPAARQIYDRHSPELKRWRALIDKAEGR
jgi:hypothetical protein